MAAAPFPSALALYLHIHYLTLSMTSTESLSSSTVAGAKLIITHRLQTALRYFNIQFNRRDIIS